MIKKSTLVFVLLSTAASALNYLVYPLFARILPSTEYVHITVSLSLFTQISTFLSSIIAITIGLSKSEQGGSATKKIELLQSYLFKLFLVLAAIFLAASPFVMASIRTPVPFALPIVLMMLFSIPISIISGYFNGRGQLVRLGLVALLSASCQAIIGLSISVLSHNGLATMLSMTIAQMITITVLYTLFSKAQLPRIITPLKQPLGTARSEHITSLLIYTAMAAVAVMVINLVQIMDLLIFQKHTDIKFYTDIYIISRVVFFAGMIFIWPFLSEISLDHHHFNRRPFLKVTSYFTLITGGALAALYLFGNELTSLLFGTHYGLTEIQHVGALSVLYKFFLLVITAVVLYFVVLHNYTAVWYALASSAAIFVFSQFINKNSNMVSVLLGLDGIAGILAILGVALLLVTPIRQSVARQSE